MCEDVAKWVRQVFDWFVAGKSIGWIARELTKLGVPKGHRASKPGWHPQQVHRMLTNPKYVGKWVWGRTAGHPAELAGAQEAGARAGRLGSVQGLFRVRIRHTLPGTPRRFRNGTPRPPMPV